MSGVRKHKPLTTEELAVHCVIVTKKKPGMRPFSGPYYLDQTDMLRAALRGMPRREDYVVIEEANQTRWIYRREIKPTAKPETKKCD